MGRDVLDPIAPWRASRPRDSPVRIGNFGSIRRGALDRTSTSERRARASSSASISGVREASVSGMPSSWAFLSAIASRRRMRPAMASLVSAGSCSCPSSSREACLCSSRSPPAWRRWSGTSSPRISRARSTRAPAATAARAERRRLASSKLASRLAVARTSRRIRRSSQAMSDSWAPSRVSSAPMASPSRMTTRSTPRTSRALALMPRRRAAPTRASAASGPGAGDLQRGGAAGLGERAVGQEGAAPGGDGVAVAAGDDLRRQPAHRAAAAVEEPGLAGQRLAVADDAHDVAAVLADAVAR